MAGQLYIIFIAGSAGKTFTTWLSTVRYARCTWHSTSRNEGWALPAFPTLLHCHKNFHQNGKIRGAKASYRIPSCSSGKARRATAWIASNCDIGESFWVLVLYVSALVYPRNPMLWHQGIRRLTIVGWIQPTVLFPAAIRSSLTRVRTAAHTGADNEVPPTSHHDPLE
jgi:hypothetical protein